MFGYVRIFKPELKVREYEEYKAVYCTLCKTLGKEYGLVSRLLLSSMQHFIFCFAIVRRMVLHSIKRDVVRSILRRCATIRQTARKATAPLQR